MRELIEANGDAWRAPVACALCLHDGAQVAVGDFAPMVANPSGLVLMHAGDVLHGWRGRADLLRFDATALAADARLAGLDPQRPFANPWLRLRTEDFLRLRQGDDAVALLRAAPAEWRKRPVPRADDFQSRGRFDLAQAVAGFLDRHWQRNVALAELEHVFGLSSFHLLRVFRRETGTTPHQYTLQLRLRRTLLAMERGPGRLATLAQAAGFSSPGHFSNAFRATWGLSPRQYAGQLPRARTPRL